MVLAFSDRRAETVLNRAELVAVQEYFNMDIVPYLNLSTFGGDKTLNAQMLSFLLSNAEIIDVESDGVPFTHKLSEAMLRLVICNLVI